MKSNIEGALHNVLYDYRLDPRENAKIHYTPYQEYTMKEICTQRKSARAAIAPSADKTPETVKDEAPLNTGDALAELLLSVVEPEPVPVPAPVIV